MTYFEINMTVSATSTGTAIPLVVAAITMVFVVATTTFTPGILNVIISSSTALTQYRCGQEFKYEYAKPLI